jgi:hypothetical protein
MQRGEDVRVYPCMSEVGSRGLDIRLRRSLRMPSMLVRALADYGRRVLGQEEWRLNWEGAVKSHCKNDNWAFEKGMI